MRVPLRGGVDPRHPVARAICDRCGFNYPFPDLQWQYDWRGNQLANTRLLVCRRCLDRPFEHFRPIIVGADPEPVMNARPERYAVDET